MNKVEETRLGEENVKAAKEGEEKVLIEETGILCNWFQNLFLNALHKQLSFPKNENILYKKDIWIYHFKCNLCKFIFTSNLDYTCSL